MNGTYVLVLELTRPEQLTIGKLGAFLFPPGHYLYFGSALNGLEARVNRHLKPDKKLHWHIDFLSSAARIAEIWWTQGDVRQECIWAQSAIQQPGVTTPIKGFGSSDCRQRCPSHLVYAPSPKTVKEVPKFLIRDSSAQIHSFKPIESEDVAHP